MITYSQIKFPIASSVNLSSAVFIRERSVLRIVLGIHKFQQREGQLMHQNVVRFLRGYICLQRFYWHLNDQGESMCISQWSWRKANKQLLLLPCLCVQLHKSDIRDVCAAGGQEWILLLFPSGHEMLQGLERECRILVSTALCHGPNVSLRTRGTVFSSPSLSH